MKTKDIIAKLLQCDQEAEVTIIHEDGTIYYNISAVWKIKDSANGPMTAIDCRAVAINFFNGRKMS